MGAGASRASRTGARERSPTLCRCSAGWPRRNARPVRSSSRSVDAAWPGPRSGRLCRADEKKKKSPRKVRGPSAYSPPRETFEQCLRKPTATMGGGTESFSRRFRTRIRGQRFQCAANKSSPSGMPRPVKTVFVPLQQPKKESATEYISGAPDRVPCFAQRPREQTILGRPRRTCFGGGNSSTSW